MIAAICMSLSRISRVDHPEIRTRSDQPEVQDPRHPHRRQGEVSGVAQNGTVADMPGAYLRGGALGSEHTRSAVD